MNPVLKRLVLAVVAIVALLFCALEIFAHINRPKTLRTYYRLERKWESRWPLGHDLLYNLEPAMIKLGVLGPARIDIERDLTLYLDPRDLVPVNILRTSEWQPEIWNSISTALPKDGVFLDIGAHIGYYSMKASRYLGNDGRVVAFEPNPEIVKLLRDNVEANKMANVIVQPIACTDKEQMLTLYAASSGNTGASSLAEANADPGGGGTAKPYQVRGRPIDDVVSELNLQRVDVIKVDVEGAEAYVLRGARETLNRFHPRIIAEVVPGQLENMKSSKKELFAWIESFGYNRNRPLNDSQTDWEFVHPSRLSSVINMSDRSTEGQLGKGFHGLENGAWRWTERAFRLTLHVPEPALRSGGVLTLRIAVPEVSLKKLNALTLSGFVGTLQLGPQTYTAQGSQVYRREIPASALGAETIDIDFLLDKHLGPPEYGTELGVIVLGAELAAKL